MTPDLLYMLSCLPGFHELYFQGQRQWMRNSRRCHERMLRVAQGQPLDISVVPRAGRDSFSAGLSGCLWVRTESRASLDALRRFRPLPTIVLSDGDTCRRTAFWALSEPLSFDWTLKANRRLAQRMGSPKKHARPTFMYTPPGCLSGRQEVQVAFCSEAIYEPAEVVGGLADPREPRIPERVAA